MRDGLRSESADEQTYRAAASFPFDIVPQGTNRIPGGFTQLSNRIIDLGIWAEMPDVVRAAYPIFCRFAENSKEYTVELSIKQLMKHSGLSESSAKRAKAWLIDHGLLRIVSKGGRYVNGGGECNIYQLQFPVVTERVGVSAEPHRGSAQNPSGGQAGTPPGFSGGPQGGSGNPTLWGSVVNHSSECPRPKTATTARGVGPALNPPPPSTPDKQTAAVAAILESKGMEQEQAIECATLFSRERIDDVIETMEWKLSRGKCDSPGGFMYGMLTRKWEVPKAIAEAKRKRLITEGNETAIREERLRQQAERENLSTTEQHIERVVSGMDSDTRASYCRRVIEMYEKQQNVTILKMIKNQKDDPVKIRLVRAEMAKLFDIDNGRTPKT